MPATLSVDQLDALLEQHDGSVLSIRDRAMLELFYSSGLRLSELTALDETAIDFQQNQVMVTGKGNKHASFRSGAKPRTRLRNGCPIAHPSPPPARSRYS